MIPKHITSDNSRAVVSLSTEETSGPTEPTAEGLRGWRDDQGVESRFQGRGNGESLLLCSPALQLVPGIPLWDLVNFPTLLVNAHLAPSRSDSWQQPRARKEVGERWGASRNA